MRRLRLMLLLLVVLLPWAAGGVGVGGAARVDVVRAPGGGDREVPDWLRSERSLPAACDPRRSRPTGGPDDGGVGLVGVPMVERVGDPTWRLGVGPGERGEARRVERAWSARGPPRG